VGLVGRSRECSLIDEVLTDVRAGRSRALVLRGGVGVGKTALLEYAARVAEGLGLERITGIESEMELATPECSSWSPGVSTSWRRCPPPARGAGGRPRPGPVRLYRRMLVSLAVLTLLSNAAATIPWCAS